MERRENCPKKALRGSGWRVLDLHRGNTWKSAYYKVPISEYDGGTRLRQTLIDFYSDMVELYERG